MTDFQIGDMVVDPVRFEGEHKIYRIVLDHTYPIKVIIGDTEACYTLDGKVTPDHLLPSLHHAGTKITIVKKQSLFAGCPG